jgi:glycosyltransferase involved in cell wall biosynthesis
LRIGINLLFLAAGRGGGIERYARGLINGLQKIDSQNEYILFTNRDCSGSFPLAPNFREISSNVSATFRPSKIAWEQCVLPFHLKRHGIDVLLSPGNISPFFHRCPSVVIMYDMIPFIRPEVFTALERAALKTLFRTSARRSDKVITISESSKGDIVRTFGIPEGKVTVVLSGCDEQFRPVPVTEEARELLKRQGIPPRYILSVASSRTYKNIDGLINAYKLLKDKYRVPQSLVITGLAGRAHPDIKRLTQRLGLTGDVVFSGFLEDRVLPLLYSAAEVFVYPSFYEGFGLPVIEAMACGTPVAASSRTSLPEAVGDAGVLFDPHNIEEMAGGMHRILSDRPFRDDLVKKGLARAKTFSWEKAASETLAALSELGGRGVRT